MASHFVPGPVSGVMGTVVQYARDQGWRPAASDDGYELDWDSQIGGHGVVVDHNWLEAREVAAPSANWDGVRELTTYLETLFEASENVGYVTDCYEKDGRFLPTRGNYDRTAGALIEALSKCGGDIGAVIGDTTPEAGACRWLG